jgi:hypothetical protein
VLTLIFLVLIIVMAWFPSHAAYRPVIPIAYSFGETGPQLSANTLVGCAFNQAAITVTSIVFTVHSYTCAVGPAVALNDCGTSIGSCNAATLATTSPSGVGTTVGSLGSPAPIIGSGHYLCAVFSSGTCTAFGWTYTLAGSVNP